MTNTTAKPTPDNAPPYRNAPGYPKMDDTYKVVYCGSNNSRIDVFHGTKAECDKEAVKRNIAGTVGTCYFVRFDYEGGVNA